MWRLWSFLESLNTRLRLALLLLAIIVPFSILLARSTLDRYELLLEQAEDRTLLHAHAAASNHREVIARTRQMLEAISRNPKILAADWPACNQFLFYFLQQFQGSYSNFHVATPDGNVVCSGLPQSHAVNLSDRLDFQDALASRSMVVGDLLLSRTTGMLSVHARYPLIRADGSIGAIISAQISAEQLAEAANRSSDLSEKADLIITDRGNRIIVSGREPGQLATLPVAEGVLARALRNPVDQVVEAVGADGILRIYAVTRTNKSGNDGLRIALGIPLEQVHGEARQLIAGNVVSMLLVIMLAILFTWTGVDVLVLRKIKILINTVRQLREGNSSARTGLDYGKDELSHVARAVDEMATELERVLALLKEQTMHDPLTGLFNRRYLSEHLNAEILKTRRKPAPIGVIMADLDHFKHINDSCGHAAGDAVLIAVAKALLESARDYDIVCRYGGEEFAIILPGADLGSTLMRAEMIRTAVENLSIRFDGCTIAPVTLSLGVAIFPEHGDNEHTLLQQADEALYCAKRTGRNRVAVAGPA